MKMRKTSSSRIFRLASRRSNRLRAPEASSRLKSTNMSTGITAAQPLAAGLRKRPATPPINSSIISAPVVKRSSTSTRKSLPCGIG
jgi:hypothetical protein